MLLLTFLQTEVQQTVQQFEADKKRSAAEQSKAEKKASKAVLAQQRQAVEQAASLAAVQQDLSNVQSQRDSLQTHTDRVESEKNDLEATLEKVQKQTKEEASRMRDVQKRLNKQKQELQQQVKKLESDLQSREKLLSQHESSLAELQPLPLQLHDMQEGYARQSAEQQAELQTAQDALQAAHSLNEQLKTEHRQLAEKLAARQKPVQQFAELQHDGQLQSTIAAVHPQPDRGLIPAGWEHGALHYLLPQDQVTHACFASACCPE